MKRNAISLIVALALLCAFALSPARPALARTKTRVVDYARDASGNPLSGKVTFVLTQKSATSPDGLVAASPTVSATLDPAGKSAVTASKKIVARAFEGSGAGLTGIAGATGGVSNTGSTTVAADSDSDGVGKLSLQIAGSEKLSVENDGTVMVQGKPFRPDAAIDAYDYGARPDAAVGFDGVTNGTTALTSAGSTFTSALVGKSVALVNLSGATFVTTVAAVPGAHTLTLSTPAPFRASNVPFAYGTPAAGPLQAALNAAAANLVSKVRLRKGLYLFTTGSVSIPESVTLEGEFADKGRFAHQAGLPLSGGGCGVAALYDAIKGDNTLAVVVTGEGTSTGSFMHLAANSSVRGMGFYYPAQQPARSAPRVYPWTLDVEGAYAKVERVELVLPYKGIYVHEGTAQEIVDVVGQPISLGLYAHNAIDSLVVRKVNFISAYSFYASCSATTAHSPLMAWILANGVAYKWGRVDLGYVSERFTFGYNVGDYFEADGTGAWINFSHGDAEVVHGIIVEQTQVGDSTSGGGVTYEDYHISNGAFLWLGGGPPAGQTPTGVIFNPTFTGRFSYNGGSVMVNSTTSLGYDVWYQAGATGSAKFTNTVFGGTVANTLKLEGPAATTTGSAQLVGNTFKATTSGTGHINISGRMGGASTANDFTNTTFANTFSSTGTVPFQTCGDRVTDNLLVCGAVGTLGNKNLVVDMGGGYFKPPSTTFANLGTPANNTFVFCTDCAEVSDPCAGGGTGSYAKRLAGRWVCSK